MQQTSSKHISLIYNKRMQCCPMSGHVSLSFIFKHRYEAFVRLESLNEYLSAASFTLLVYSNRTLSVYFAVCN